MKKLLLLLALLVLPGFLVLPSISFGDLPLGSGPTMETIEALEDKIDVAKKYRDNLQSQLNTNKAGGWSGSSDAFLEREIKRYDATIADLEERKKQLEGSVSGGT